MTGCQGCGKRLVCRKGYGAFSGDSAGLEGYAGRGVVVQSLRLDGKKFAT